MVNKFVDLSIYVNKNNLTYPSLLQRETVENCTFTILRENYRANENGQIESLQLENIICFLLLV